MAPLDRICELFQGIVLASVRNRVKLCGAIVTVRRAHSISVLLL